MGIHVSPPSLLLLYSFLGVERWLKHHWPTSGKGQGGQETEKARLCIPQGEQDLFHVKYNFLIFYLCY